MKKIALISTFCDTEEKQNVLLENILKLKNLGLDIMVISPNFVIVKQDIIDLCDFFFTLKKILY
jgi:3-polyprenyl-4-hydroxybenzoate decarboxylase